MMGVRKCLRGDDDSLKKYGRFTQKAIRTAKVVRASKGDLRALECLRATYDIDMALLYSILRLPTLFYHWLIVTFNTAQDL